MSEVKVGKVSHYYGHISVAVLDLEKELKVGDKIKFMHDKDELFQQEVTSMELDHKKIDTASKGKSIGMKVDEKVHEGVEVYKVG